MIYTQGEIFEIYQSTFRLTLPHTAVGLTFLKAQFMIRFPGVIEHYAINRDGFPAAGPPLMALFAK